MNETMLVCPKCKSTNLSQKKSLNLFKCTDCKTEYALMPLLELAKDELF